MIPVQLATLFQQQQQLMQFQLALKQSPMEDAQQCTHGGPQ